MRGNCYESPIFCWTCKCDILDGEEVIHCPACGHDFCADCDHVEEELEEDGDIPGTGEEEEGTEEEAGS